MGKYKPCCPDCGAIWTLEEIEENSCGACGYPENNEPDNNFYPDSFDDWNDPQNDHWDDY